MAFPSPASDYTERVLTPEAICGIGIDSRILETGTGFAVIEPVSGKADGDVLLILCGGYTQFAKLMGGSLITDEGEAIEGEALEEVEVLGRVTFFINQATDDDSPVM
ncbi:hypothetical protein [Kosakonia sp.]|uniref:hypothetical protein n=1 Tax=Kosakonia sp. TaxID=1916651 RepID=UPI00289B2D86|nr:hypothetical protein [Kosakonia sp.]